MSGRSAELHPRHGLVGGALAALAITLVVRQAGRRRVEARRVEVLEEIDRQRAALLRSVSHDLRSPLATIRGVSTDLRDRDELDPASRRQLLDLVVSESERLDRIVANLLSLSRIEAGALEPEREPVDVEEMIERSVSRLGRLFEDGSLRVVVPPGLPFADVDATQIDQVIANLLENAARHTPAGTVVCVGAGDAGDMIRITVDDTGPGIPPQVRDRVSTHGAPHGRAPASGIGLTICRAIVEAHGGTLCIDAGAQPGTRVSFTIPRAERSTPATVD